jgi:hypothetical protein
MYHSQELNSAVFKRTNAILTKALHGGKQLTRDELRVVLEKAGVASQSNLRLAYIIMQAELEGIICSGARRGKQFTYALLDERVPPAKMLNRDEALTELAHRFFSSRGPATVQDFSKWSGLTIADARNGLEAIRRLLRQEVVDGQTYWLAKDTASVKTRSPTAYLFSIYDEYLSGYKDRSAIFDAKYLSKLRAVGNGIAYVVVMDGQIVGSWKRAIKKDAVIIQTSMFKALTDSENRAIATAAARYGKYLGLTVTLA